MALFDSFVRFFSFKLVQSFISDTVWTPFLHRFLESTRSLRPASTTKLLLDTDRIHEALIFAHALRTHREEVVSQTLSQIHSRGQHWALTESIVDWLLERGYSTVTFLFFLNSKTKKKLLFSVSAACPVPHRELGGGPLFQGLSPTLQARILVYQTKTAQSPRKSTATLRTRAIAKQSESRVSRVASMLSTIPRLHDYDLISLVKLFDEMKPTGMAVFLTEVYLNTLVHLRNLPSKREWATEKLQQELPLHRGEFSPGRLAQVCLCFHDFEAAAWLFELGTPVQTPLGESWALAAGFRLRHAEQSNSATEAAGLLKSHLTRIVHAEARTKWLGQLFSVWESKGWPVDVLEAALIPQLGELMQPLGTILLPSAVGYHGKPMYPAIRFSCRLFLGLARLLAGLAHNVQETSL
jgi:hypothetical protein